MANANCYKVYKLTCLKNGKLYFGITKRDVSERMKQHRYFANKGSSFLISRAIRKYGWGCFSVETVLSGLSKEDACAAEERMIKTYNTCFSGGYNMTPGGESGVSLRPETKERRIAAGRMAWENSEKMQAVVKDPERNRKIGEHSRLMHQRPEYRKKFLDRHKRMIEASLCPEARSRSAETFKKNGHCRGVVCSNGMSFESVAEAADWVATNTGGTGLSKRSNIAACANGRRAVAYGHTWSRP